MFFKKPKTDILEKIERAEKRLEEEKKRFAENREQFHNLSALNGREVLGDYIAEIYRQRSR